MGLFDKKYCDVCGEKIGLLGNKKLEDANLCKNCAAKLSPWFNDRRHSTLEEIKQQLAYREENKERVSAFTVTRSLGRGSVKLYVDENAGRFMITSAGPRNFEEKNPDVLELSQVTGVDLNIQELRYEEFDRDDDGKQVSYNPKRYEYKYDFSAEVRVNHPYFDEMNFRLNNSSVSTGNRSVKGTSSAPANDAPAAGVAGVVGNILGALSDAVSSAAMTAEYQEYVNMGNEIKEVLMGGRNAAPAAADGAAAPKEKVTCPVCKATVIPDENGCCEYCGSPLT